MGEMHAFPLRGNDKFGANLTALGTDADAE